MTETAGQLLSHAVPVCQWLPQNTSNPTSTLSAYPRFPETVREWTGFSRAIRLTGALPGGQFPLHATIARPLRVEDDAKTRLYQNVLAPVDALLPAQGPQEATFCATPRGFLGLSDHVLCTNNSTVAKMPVEIKTRHNLDLGNYNLWEVYRSVDRNRIRDGDPNMKFKKRILSQAFGAMACNGLHYCTLSNYSDTYFLKREEARPTTLYATSVFRPNDTNPTLCECVYYISQLALADNVGNRLEPVEKRKSSSKQTGSKKRAVPSSSKGITTIDEYIGGGSFGKVFSGKYHDQAVAWKTCDAYKEKEKKEMLRVEANVYSILKECQGHAIPCLFYEGYVYDGYLYALALQLIEDARHIDTAVLTTEEKESIIEQLKSIHSFGVLHNDIAQRNILFEPKREKEIKKIVTTLVLARQLLTPPFAPIYSFCLSTKSFNTSACGLVKAQLNLHLFI
ncbi:12177_t:CDS:2 [Funneliformis geosporum]|uniref:11758_t:CDS:1 n=1 Tax=Funneliformis geosporum TaxID=1117311 RepID=A0A9W4T541_9GLOM|nr:11758_t:CDS:2 [Funneliformis geosporum]CAI2191333.1 12177_t:CDS:2 [Funneliformis geosporum]